jgi:16S rRNA (cytidine1402-2'-O)-methyltransferase
MGKKNCKNMNPVGSTLFLGPGHNITWPINYRKMSNSASNPRSTLFLIPTVVAEGTAQQVLTPQIIDVIGKLDFFFAEELRTARRFVSSLRLGRVIEDLTFHELNKKTPEAKTAAQLRALPAGKDIGVMSEAGCPGIADPGAVAVRLAHQMGMKVVPLVGPSSILLALMASGLSGQSFAFHGYLPIDQVPRRKAILFLEKEVRELGQTQIFMETPFRNNHMMQTILEACQPDTLLCVASNLTSPDEYIKTQTIRHWKTQKIDLHKQPTLFLLG